jgi:hypothetical protein
MRRLDGTWERTAKMSIGEKCIITAKKEKPSSQVTRIDVLGNHPNKLFLESKLLTESS